MPNEGTSSPCLILSSCSNEEEARNIAAKLVEAGLAGCVSVLPGVESTYRWQGAVERSSEVLLLIKTGAGHLEGVQKLLLELNSYEVPEFLALEVVGGSAAYLAWLAGALK